jgi:hypothetical protein
MKGEWIEKDVHVVIDDAIIDSGDVSAIIDPVWYTANIYDGPAAYEESCKGLSTQQRYVLAISWYLAEVNNGGHKQFYSNSTGIVWEDAMKGFADAGLPEFAELIRKSAEGLGGSPSKQRDERNDQLDRMKPDFSEADDKLYKTEARIAPVLLEYIKKNREHFYFDGIVKMPVREE